MVPPHTKLSYTLADVLELHFLHNHVGRITAFLKTISFFFPYTHAGIFYRVCSISSGTPW